MPVDANRVQSLFAAAAAAESAERVAVLDRECAGDDDLRGRVEALLKAHDDSAELPAAESTRAFPPALEAGQVLAGCYKLREKLGEGGMGTVFVADQIKPVQRRVALKLIRLGLDSQRLLARFEQERQALALMDHPNIAKVFDAGIDEAGRPYFAMELVKGLPLTKYCDDAKLSAQQRIELFTPVCQAVQHAHQKGIIHRDLKPSNILIGLYDGRAVPKVIDFGVAKATGPRLTDQSIYTEVGSLVGTLEYMSPEQAELNNLDIDTRSDVYALGVILYELLTGAVPFSRKDLEKAGLAEMLRVIKEVEPPRPSTKLSGSGALPSIAANRHTDPKKLTALVRGELDWIVMKALEKDRGRRYETANGLAMDVQRYLAGEPVLAAPASTAYRFKKFVRRNQGPVLAASVLLLALLVGVAGTTWGLIRADHERRIAEDNADKADAAAAKEKLAKERAEANFILARESVEKYLGTVTDVPELKNADFYKLRKKLLESALPFFQRMAAEKSDDPAVEMGRGRAYHRLASVRAGLGENEAAIQDYEAMRAIFAQLVADFPTVPAYRRELAWSHNNLGLLLKDLGKRSEAEAAYGQAMTIYEKLAADFPTVPAYRQDLARCQNNLGLLLAGLGRPSETEATYRQALTIYEKLVADFPTMPAYRQDLARSQNNLGNLLKDLGKHAKAEAAYRQTLAIYEKLAADFPTAPEYGQELARSHNSLGVLLASTGKRPDAEAAYRQALAIQEKLVADFSTVPAYRQELAQSHNNMGNLLKDLGKHSEAEAANRQALVIFEKLAADFPTVPLNRQELARSYNNLGNLLKALGKQPEAEAAHRQALGIFEKLAADFPTVPAYRQELATSHNNLANSLAGLGKRSEAEAAYRQALAIQEKLAADFPTAPAYRQDLARSHHNMGALLARLGKHLEAEAAYRKALAIYERLATEFPTVPAYAVELGCSYGNLGHLIRDSGQPETALGWYQKAIARLEQVVAQEPRLVDARQFLRNSHWYRARALDALGRHVEATRDWERALELDDGRTRETIRSNLAVSRLRGARKNKDAAGCLAAAAEWEALKRTDARGLYDATCYRAVCAAVIPEDPKTPAADAARLAREQTDLAMAWLHKAVAAGFKDAAQMKKDTDLDALRERDDFKKLLADLEKSAIERASPPKQK